MTIILDGTTGITTPAINSSGDLELPGGTANGVLYLNGSKIATSGSALVFDGTNLGVGTASPGSKLDVNGNGNFSGTLGATLPSSVGSITLRNSSTTSSELHVRPASGKDGWLSFTEDTVADRWIIGTKNGNGGLFFNTGSPGTNTDRMTLDASGNLLVGGTASPGTIWASDRTFIYAKGNSTNKSGEVIVESNSGNQQASFFASGSTGEFGIWSTKNQPMVFGTNNTERARITAGGNLLVGTTTDLSGGPRVRVQSYGNYYWGSGGGLGDFYVGDGTYGLSIGVATGGGGAGTIRIWAQNNGVDVLALGTNDSDSLTITGTNVSIAGALSKGSGSFRIDHPLKPDTHQLVHSFIEGPQADLIYRGKATLVNGRAEVNIDAASGMTEGTFVALCRDVQCFTSNESDWDAVRGSVSGNTLTIECQNPNSTATISWMVVGERQDKHMYDTDWTDENGKVIVEPEKQLN